MNVNCNPGSAIIPSSSGAAAGPYLAVNNILQTLTHVAADPTNPRIDLWSIQVVDNGNNTSLSQLVITQGVPAASPAVPSTPTNAVPLAQVRVNAGVSSITQGNITDVRQYSGMAGGIVLCPNMASLPVGWNGQLGYDLTNNRLFHLTATGAQPIHVMGFPAVSAVRTTNLIANGNTETSVLSVNFTADGVSDYDLSAQWGDAANGIGNDQTHLRIYMDSTNVQDNQAYTCPAIAGLYHYGTQWVRHITSSLKGTTPAAGSHTVSFRVFPVANNMTVYASANTPIEIIVRQASI
jgi:hypothetical protein